MSRTKKGFYIHRLHDNPVWDGGGLKKNGNISKEIVKIPPLQTFRNRGKNFFEMLYLQSPSTSVCIVSIKFIRGVVVFERRRDSFWKSLFEQSLQKNRYRNKNNTGPGWRGKKSHPLTRKMVFSVNTMFMQIKWILGAMVLHGSLG